MIRSELKPADYIVILKRRWIPIVVLTLIGGPVGYAVSRVLPARYTSQTTVLVQPPTVPDTLVPPVVSADIDQQLASMKEQILSRSRLEPLIRQFGLYSGDVNSVPMEALVGKLQKAISVSGIQPMQGTSRTLPGFNVTVTWDNPLKAQQVCGTITSMFIDESERLRQQNSESTTQFLTQQLNVAKAKLDDQNAKLAAFQSRYLGSLPDDDKNNLNILTGLTAQLTAATESVSRAQQDKSFIESSLSQAVQAWQASRTGANPVDLQQQLAQLQSKLADLQSRYTDNYPDVIRTKADIAALQKQIAAQSAGPSTTSNSPKTEQMAVEPQNIQQLRAQLHSSEVLISQKTAEEAELKHQIAVYEQRVQASPDVEQQYKALTLGQEAALKSYNELQQHRDEAQMATDLEKRQEGETFAILDPANLPDQPSFPNRLMFIGGGFAGGLALGFGLAFLGEMRDTSIRTEQDVEFALRLPVIVMVPAIGPLATSKPKKFTPSFGQGIGEN
ncbi:MAG TPA: Wzz/FepE/Etk N-terminal domain-containing protein [Candidatus Acidoferrales bacterium]|nr:Wzz/FepE/Etk N-terminal domain-containing protein [Candidatus Acidoferrales bacterium]